VVIGVCGPILANLEVDRVFECHLYSRDRHYVLFGNISKGIYEL